MNTPETIGMFTLFAELIAFHLDAQDRLTELEAEVERRTLALHDTNVALGHQMAIGEADRQTLRALTERLERVREDERTALARELHDEFGQSLTALKLDLSALSRVRARAGHQMRLATIAGMTEVVDSALDAIERIVAELRPAVLDALGCWMC